MSGLRQSRAYSIIFMAAISAVFVSLVSLAALGARDRITLNREAATKRQLVKAAVLWDRQKYTDAEQIPAAEVERIFAERISGPRELDGLELYYARDPVGNYTAIILSVSGMGFWGPIHGWLALEPGTNAIKGITFDRQEETPGLGGEIVKPWFQNQFVGIVLEPPRPGRPSLELVKDAAERKPHQVDAITGASRTSYGVQNLLNDSIGRFFAAGGDKLPTD